MTSGLSGRQYIHRKLPGDFPGFSIDQYDIPGMTAIIMLNNAGISVSSGSEDISFTSNLSL